MAALFVSKGSSASKDSFRDEGRPDEDEVDSVDIRESGDEDAREASSRESRVVEFMGGCMYRDMLGVI